MDKLIMTREKFYNKHQDYLGFNKAEFNKDLDLLLNQQTPITPESLGGIGFMSIYISGEMFILNIPNSIGMLIFNPLTGKLILKTDIYETELHFAHTEQITDWLKPFTNGVAEEVR